MPSKDARQHFLFELVAHNPAAARRLGIKQSVGQDFVDADKAAGKHFSHPAVDHNGHVKRR